MSFLELYKSLCGDYQSVISSQKQDYKWIILSSKNVGVIPCQIIQTAKLWCQGFASRLHHSKVLMK